MSAALPRAAVPWVRRTPVRWRRYEDRLTADWPDAAGPYAESIALYFKVGVEGHSKRGGDPFLGARLPSLARAAGFVRVEATPSYSAGLSNVKATATAMLSVLEYGVSAERFERLAHEISTWAESPDSIAAFAECTVLAWKP